MIVRISKCCLVAGIALFFTLVVVNNTTDYDTNFQFVRHVLSMDTTLAGNGGMWRALRSSAIHRIFYASIICWEAVTACVAWWGVARLGGAVRKPAAEFAQAKGVAAGALAMGMMLWLVAFLVIGGEWFLMWQSAAWNGQQAAFRMFCVLGLVLVYLEMPYGE
jgi:predicted small integral membrane protein